MPAHRPAVSRRAWGCVVLGALHLTASGGFAQQDRTGSSRILGVAVDHDTGSPLEDVAIRLVGRQTLTDANGRFAFPELAPGTYALTAHHLAYGEVSESVEVPWRSTVRLEIRLAVDPVEVEPITVTVEGVRDRRLEIKGFYERKEWGEKLGLGRFFDREDIERRSPLLISQLVADVPSVRLDCSRSYRSRTCEVTSTRTSPLTCRRMNVYVDGTLVLDALGERDRRFGGDVMRLDEFVSPADVGGVEVYTSMAELPARFADISARCGAVVVWTRGN